MPYWVFLLSTKRFAYFEYKSHDATILENSLKIFPQAYRLFRGSSRCIIYAEVGPNISIAESFEKSIENRWPKIFIYRECHQPIASSQFYWKCPENLGRKMDLLRWGKSGNIRRKFGSHVAYIGQSGTFLVIKIKLNPMSLLANDHFGRIEVCVVKERYLRE